MKLAGAWYLAPATRGVMAALAGGGQTALFVGGCVRDDLLRRPVRDIDIATDARPERVVTLVEAAGLRAVPTGLGHGTVTVVSGDVAHEVTTFRRDVSTDGRRATVAFADDCAVDAARRDFTMNALYAEAGGRVLDPLGGLDDLRTGRVRFIGDAAARIGEDYLRILRFFRFHAWYGDPGEGIDTAGLAACAALTGGIDGLSRERVGAEMLRLLAAPDPAPALAAMAQAGVLARVLPGAAVAAVAPLVALEQDAGVLPAALRRLAVLGGAGVAECLRLSRADASGLDRRRAIAGSSAGLPEIAWRAGAALATDVALIRAASGAGALPGGWRDDIAAGAAARFPVTAADLMPAYSGPALGRKLAALERRWIETGFAATRDELLS